MSTKDSILPYDPSTLSRELNKFYISATEQETQQMLEALNKTSLEQLFESLPQNIKMTKAPNIASRLEYNKLATHLLEVSEMNNIKTSFIGDGLKSYSLPDIVSKVCDIRGLTTAYTPYQPERSQGTLYSLWVYSSCLSMLTGFEAINASFYDRATCLYEAIATGLRLHKKGNTALVFGNIYPGDIEVLNTQAKETEINIVTIPVPSTGTISKELLESWIEKIGDDLAVVAFPQVNNFGLLEDVHGITDLCYAKNLQTIAIIDPMLLATGGLVAPSEFGSEKQGAHMIVGEGQHLCLGPNFGGPGLGIFGIRFNDQNKLSIRSTAGRFVGKTKDEKGRDCLTMVLSTREQHIRREKATSNICSNQSFVATIAGAAILARGEEGMKSAHTNARNIAIQAFEKLCSYEGVEYAFKDAPFYNEFTLKLNTDVDDLIEKARHQNLHLGVNVSDRIKGDQQLLLLSFFDHHTINDLKKLYDFFNTHFTHHKSTTAVPHTAQELKRSQSVNLPQIEASVLEQFYHQLGDLNVSPDDNIYPLGSCTMKYNPHINDWAAGLAGFTQIHPQAPIEDAQGCLHILYQIQEIFKGITGLPAVTTQPVAGAQGELVGLKMFQAYHRDQGEADQRQLLLIPRSAHGTNPATATMAGYQTQKKDGIPYGIITVDANEKGQIDMQQLKEIVKEHGPRIAGIMVTNPNTSGIFENDFKEMAELIHKAGGLVYMDGANMNAIAGQVNLNSLGVDAVHNNLHKTWTIPHGGGGPGDGIVAVSEKLINYLPGIQVIKDDNKYITTTTSKSIGSFHRHFGNFAHKVRAYTYLRALGGEGVKKMSAIAVLAAQYLYHELRPHFPSLPVGNEQTPRMHEFILTISNDMFEKIQAAGTPKNSAIAKIGKLFLDFGIHSPTVAFPEQFGLMIEPTESYSKQELDRFIDVIKSIKKILNENPEVLQTAPHFTPLAKVDEVYANKNLILSEALKGLPKLPSNPFKVEEFNNMSVGDIAAKIVQAHKNNQK